MRLLSVTIACAALLVIGSPRLGLHAQVLDPGMPVVNGVVRALEISGNTLFIGGWFSRVADATGTWVPLDPSTGAPIGTFPMVSGTVETAAPDGSGGWYIGGDLKFVGGQACAGVAHIRSDGSVDPVVPGCDYPPQVLLVQGNLLYLGGFFTQIDGQSRHHLAAYDVSLGQLTAWNPDVDAAVEALAVSGTTLYVGGAFSTVGGVSRKAIAAISTISGAPTSWNPAPGLVDGTFGPPSVYDIALYGATVYLAGHFSSIGGQSRRSLAAIDGTTGNATSWNPNPDLSPNPPPAYVPWVNRVEISGTTAYVCGYFTSMNGAPRAGLAAFDLGSGNLLPWDPAADGYSMVDLSIRGSIAYVAGGFHAIGGQPRNKVAAVDATSGIATSWNPDPDPGPYFDSHVMVVAPGPSAVWVGGDFPTLGGAVRNNLAAIDLSTRRVTSWNPGVTGQVYALRANGPTLFVGGDFSAVGGQPRAGMAAVTLATGAVTSWNPNPAPARITYALEVSGGTVYAATNFPGSFGTVGGQPRGGLTGLDGLTGAATAWDARANGPVLALALAGGRLYAGGTFSSIGGQSRSGLAALDLASGNAEAWNPGPDNAVSALALSDSTLYLAGAFSSVGGQPRNRLASVSIASGGVLPWDPDPTGFQEPAALATSGAVYVGGEFSAIDGQGIGNLAAADPVTGSALPWDPELTPGVNALLVHGQTVYAGGRFGRVLRLPRQGLVALSRFPFPVDSVPVDSGPPPSGVRIASPAPNPAREGVDLQLTLPTASAVTASIVDPSGRTVRSIVSDGTVLGPGVGRLRWDGRDRKGNRVSAGVYFFRLTVDGHRFARPIVILN